MTGRADLHGSLGDIYVRQLQKLVIHAGQLALHVVGWFVRDVEEGAAVLGTAALAHFGVDRTRNHVAGGELHLLGVVALHESLAVLVAEHAPFAALHAGWPYHAGGMKLNELHVHQVGACIECERHTVAGVFPGVRGDLPCLADSSGTNDDGLSPEHNEAALLAPIAECSGDAITVFEQSCDGAFHVDVDAEVDAAILQGADHLEAGAVSDMA